MNGSRGDAARSRISEESELEPFIISPIPVEPAMYYYNYPGSVKKNLFDNREPGDLSVGALIAPDDAARLRPVGSMEENSHPGKNLHGMNCDLLCLRL